MIPASCEAGDLHSSGQDEQSLAPHGVSGLGRAEYSCRNAVAQSLQWRDDGRKLLACIPRDVLAEDKIRPALAGDPDDLGSKEPLSVRSGTLSGDAVVLAWVARSEDMNEATPRSSVEGEQVRPDRSRMKPPCFHRRHQRRGGSGFPLHVADRASRRHSQTDAEFEPSGSGAQGHDIEGT